MAQPQFFFFTGTNAYALAQEVRRWKISFVAKHGSENLESLIGAQQTAAKLKDAVATMPFIAQRRLVLCEGVPKIDKADLPGVLEVLHPQVIFVIYDGKPDKRLSITKELLERAEEVKTFDPLSPFELAAWMSEHVAGLGSSIQPQAVTALLATVGNDQWMLKHELDKLAAACGETIEKDDVDRLCAPSGTQVIWQLTDLLGKRKVPEAIAFFRRMLDRGEDPYGIWVIVLNAIKNLAAIRMCLDGGTTDERSLSNATGVHFLGVRGMLPLAKSLSKARCKALVDWAAESDIALKTGGYKYTAERPDELITLVERAMLQCR